MRKLLGALFALSSIVVVGPSRSSAASFGGPEVRFAVQQDDSPALRDIPPGAPEPSGERREMHPHGRPRLSHRRGLGGSHLPDPVVQDAPGALPMPPADGSFDGIPNVDLVLPPDPNGAVGPHHYVQIVNTSFAVYDKSGTLLYGPAEANTLWDGFGGPCETDNEGDPIVLHDHLADRWLMSQLALPNFPFGPFYECVAISATADPTGSYHRYAFIVSDTKLDDYPKFAVWPDGYYLTVNQFNEGTLSYGGQGVVAFERDRMLAGLPAAMVYLDLYPLDPNLGGMLPADMDGSPPPAGAAAYFVQFDDDAWGYTSQDQLQIWRFHVDWTNPAASTFTGPVVLPTAPFDSNLCGYSHNCLPQRGTSRKVDAIADRLMYRLQYRNFVDHETLVVNHTVDVGGDHAGIRWYELRDPGGVATIRQQGTYAPDADHRWMGSAAMDAAGDLAIGFSVSGTQTFPSIRYAGRLASDPLGTLAQGETTLVAGGGSQTDTSGRWGDYSALSLDPNDQCSFWYTQEYYPAMSSIGWHTRIGSFRFASCTVDVPLVTLVATVPTTPEAGTMPGAVTFTRTGSVAADLVVHYTVRGTATPGDDYVPLPGTVVIPAGAASATVPVTPIDDSLIEDDELVVLTLAADAAYAAGTPSSATVTIVNDDLPPDLVIEGFGAPTTAASGDTITVTDTTHNTGGAAAPASTTRFYLSANATLDAADVPLADRPIPPLAPGDASTATTAVTIPANTPAGTRWLIARADAGGVVVEGSESNNTTARSIQIGGDLVVSALTVPATSGAGLPLVVTDTTKNQTGATVPASTTGFYLSANGTIDAGDVLLGSRPVPALAAGETSKVTTTLTVPPGTVTGTYSVIAKADLAGAIAELNETNNTRAGTVRIGPDLTLAGVSAPSTAAAGGAIVVTDTTKNAGGGPAGTSTTAFYLSTDTRLDAADGFLGSRPVPPLDPGLSSTASTTVTIPAATGVGTYYILVRLDAGDAVAETSETNNVVARSIQIGPDLVVSALSAPSVAAAGTSISVTDTTKNQGASTAGASTTAFYLSADGVLDATDTLLGSRAIPALAAGASSTATTVLMLPAGLAAGDYAIIAQADSSGAVGETVETNNLRTRIVNVGPDLVVFLTAPASVATGGAISVSDTTTNQGGAAADPSTTRFYLSTNATLGAGDVVLGQRSVPSLAAGASSTVSTTLVVPPLTPPGSYWVIAVADADGIVAEALEENNTRSRGIQVTP